MSDLTPVSYISGYSVRQRISRPQAKGLPIVNMGYNELPYPPSARVQAAIAEAAAHANRYGSALCTELRQELAARYGLPVEDLICGNGSEELLDVIARCFVRAGDEIIISQYGYIQFSIIANRLGARLVQAPEKDFTTQVDHVLSAVSDNTKLVLLANPNNPTGTMVPHEELARLAQCLPGHVVLVLDLAYGEFVSADYCAGVHELALAHENVLVTRTFSKVYGLAGLRVGWCHAPGAMMASLNAAKGVGSISAAAQVAAVAVLQEQDAVDARVKQIVAERERLVGALETLGLNAPDSHTNFVMCAIPGDDGARATALTEYLFDEAGIVVGPVREPGLERFVRFSLSLPEHNDLLIANVRAFLQSSAL